MDCTQSVECARDGLKMFRDHVSDKPVVAVIYTHTHIDHHGGVKGVVDPADVASGKVPIIAPGTVASFDKYALGENIIGGNAMSRRAGYAFGTLLPFGPHGEVTTGIGCGGNHNETISYLSPTDPITDGSQTRVLAGLTFEFLYAPRHRGAGRDAPVRPRAQRPQLRGERQPFDAQHPDPARSAVDEFDLDRGVDRLGGGVVQRGADPAHGLDHAQPLAGGVEGGSGVFEPRSLWKTTPRVVRPSPARAVTAMPSAAWVSPASCVSAMA